MKSIQEIFKIGKGPSSSHTIGPERAATLFRSEHPDADAYRVILYESLSKTGKGHGTDRVLREVLSPKPTEIVFAAESPADLPHPNTMDFEAIRDGQVTDRLRVLSIGGGDIRVEGQPGLEPPEVYSENTYAEVEQFLRFRGLNLAEYVEFNEGEEIWPFLEKVWATMKNAIEEGLHHEGELPGGLHILRKAKLLYNQDSGNELPQVRECRILSAYAFAVSEQNADCGTIVTAPTCGACGILPAVLRYAQETSNFSDEQIIHGLAVAGLFGNIIKRNASISGAECGCQAEIGTACSMAAAALCELFGMGLGQIEYAAEVAMEHMLGLTCDPVCGLVQIPCIERNAIAAMRAINALSLANFLSNTRRVSFDTVVATMYRTGKDISARYRETSQGGLAAFVK